MIISNSGSEPETNVGINSVNKWELSTVINVCVSQFDEFDFVFLTFLVLHLDLYQIF